MRVWKNVINLFNTFCVEISNSGTIIQTLGYVGAILANILGAFLVITATKNAVVKSGRIKVIYVAMSSFTVE